MLKNKCCLYVIISIRFFAITICNLLIEFPSYLPEYKKEFFPYLSPDTPHLTIPFQGGMHSFKRGGVCAKGKALVGRLWQKSKWSRSDRRKINCKRHQRVRHNTTNSVVHVTEEAKTETISPNAATKITTQWSPSKDDFLHWNASANEGR